MEEHRGQIYPQEMVEQEGEGPVYGQYDVLRRPKVATTSGLLGGRGGEGAKFPGGGGREGGRPCCGG